MRKIFGTVNVMAKTDEQRNGSFDRCIKRLNEAKQIGMGAMLLTTVATIGAPAWAITQNPCVLRYDSWAAT